MCRLYEGDRPPYSRVRGSTALALLLLMLCACQSWGPTPPIATLWLCEAGSSIDAAADGVERLVSMEESASIVVDVELQLERAGEHLSITVPDGYDAVHGELLSALQATTAAFASYRSYQLEQARQELESVPERLRVAHATLGQCDGWTAESS